MITSKQDLQEYLRLDSIANSIPVHPSFSWNLKQFFFPNYTWEYIYTLRKCEYYYNSLKKQNIMEVGKLYVLQK